MGTCFGVLALMGALWRRYLYEDTLLLAVRASPPAKAATLFRESQALVHAVRAELDGRDVRGDAEVCHVPGLVSCRITPCSMHASLRARVQTKASILSCCSLPS